MRLIERHFEIPCPMNCPNLWKHISDSVIGKLIDDDIPIRFVVTKSSERTWEVELGVLSGKSDSCLLSTKSIFHFRKRPFENSNFFNVVLVIPTGIGAALGGHAGDAGALCRVIANACDTLVTHPNVVNASDINELTDNTLYVEGSVLSRLLMGTVGLQKVRSNRILVIIDDHPDSLFTDSAINSVSAARVTLGIDCVEVVKLANKFNMGTMYSPSGRAAGAITKLDGLFDLLQSRRDNYDAIALSTVIDIPLSLHKDYYTREMVNPWGGVEAMLTHAISNILDLPSAHSPMLDSQEELDLELGVVDPRMAAEAVSTTFLHCILKGLHRSPRIITEPIIFDNPAIFSAKDVSCLIMPDGCIGLPTLAALQQGIPVIAVKENANIMGNNLLCLPWQKGQLTIVENYWEAIGLLVSLRSGVEPDLLRRPIKKTNVTNARP